MIKNRLSDWYIKGHIQKAVTSFVFLAVSIILAKLLEYSCQGYVLWRAGPILAKYVPLNEVMEIKRLLMAASDGFLPVLVFGLFFACGSLWALLKFSTRLDLVGRIVLDKALRFTDALEGLGLRHDWEQFHFVRHYDIPVYIANKPLLTAEAYSVKASFYPYIKGLLVSPSSLDAYKGSKRICLKAADLAEALNKLRLENSPAEPETEAATPTLSNLQARLADLEIRNKILQNQLVETGTRIKELEVTNETLKNELHGHTLRDGKNEKAQKRLMLYSLGLAPIFHKLTATKYDRRDLTKPALMNLFKTSVDSTPALKSLLVGLGEKNPTDLPENIGDLLWENLKILDLTSPGGSPPTGYMARLKKIIFESG